MKADAKIGVSYSEAEWAAVRKAVRQIGRNADEIELWANTRDPATSVLRMTPMPLRAELEKSGRAHLVFKFMKAAGALSGGKLKRVNETLREIKELRERFVDSGLLLLRGTGVLSDLHPIFDFGFQLKGVTPTLLDLGSLKKRTAINPYGAPETEPRRALMVHDMWVACLAETEVMLLEEVEWQKAKGRDRPPNRTEFTRDTYFASLLQIWVEIGGDPKKKQQTEAFMRAAAKPVLGVLGNRVVPLWLAKWSGALTGGDSKPRVRSLF